MAKALARTMQDENGRVFTSYVDLITLQPVTDLNGYAVIQPAEIQPEELPYADIPYYSFDGPPVAKPQEDAPAFDSEGREIPDELLSNDGALGGDSHASLNGPKRDASNSWGYREKPGWLGALSLIPGALGLAPKAASVAMNINNEDATNKARQAIGLPARSSMDSLKGAIKNVGPDVSKNVDINGSNYGIALGAKSPAFGGVMKDGTLGLTMDEASRRASLLGGLKEGPQVKEKAGMFDKRVDDPQAAPAMNRPNNPTNGLHGVAARAGNKQPNMDKSFAANVSYNMGPMRPEAPDTGFQSRVANIVGTTLGPNYGISLTSGTYADEKQDAINAARQDAIDKGLSPSQVNAAGKKAGQFGSTRHTTSLAADMHIVNKETGQVVTDKNTINSVAEAAAAAGLSVGVGPQYMGGTAIHVDDTRPSNPNTWGAGQPPSQTAAIRDAQQTAAYQNESLKNFKSAPTPGVNPRNALTTNNFPSGPSTASPAKPETRGMMANVQQSAPTGYGVMGYSSAISQAQNKVSTPTATPSSISSVPAGPMSPSSFSSMGMGAQYTDREKGLMGATIAGELGPNSLRGLVAGDPVAQAEAASIAGTMDNRAMSRAFASKPSPMASALTAPGAYNALDDDKISTTADNYSKFGPQVNSMVGSYLSGTAPSASPNSTSYNNKGLVKTNYADDLIDAVGLHTFGTPENPSLEASQSAYGKAYGPAAGVGIGVTGTPGSSFGSSAVAKSDTAGYGHISSDIGKSGVSSGKTGGISGMSGMADGKKGSESYGGGYSAMGYSGSSLGTRGNSPGGATGFGGMMGGSTKSSTGSTGSATSKSGSQAGSNSPRGMGNSSMSGATSGSSAKSGSAGGSASSASSGNSRGGMSSGRGQGGFN